MRQPTPRLPLPHLDEWPPWARPLLILATYVLYVGLFALFYPHLGANIIALAFVPVAVAGFMTGWRGGVTAGGLMIALHLALLGPEVVLVRSLFSHLSLLAVGAITGGLAEVVGRSRQQAHQLEQERAALQAQMEELAATRATLQASEARLNSILNSAMDAIITIDVGGRILFFNRAAEEMFQCPAAEAMAQPLSRFIPPRLRDQHQDNLLNFSQSDDSKRFWRGTGVSAGLRADGQTFPLEATIARTEQNGQQLFTLILRDVTEFAGAERALQESEVRFRAVADSLGEGLILTDLNDKILYVNQRMADLLDRTSEEMLYQRCIDLLWPPEEAALLEARHDRRRQGINERYETRLRRRDGTTFWAEINASPLRDARGTISGTLGAVTDISERKRADDLLRSQQALLEQIARGVPLPELLANVAQFVEQRTPVPAFASLLLTDDTGQVLRHGARPNLPPTLIEALDGVPIGPAEGSSGTAAYRQEPVIVADISASPLWESYRDLVLAHGLRACWAMPILNSEGAVLGTLAVYYPEVYTPGENERRLVAIASHVAGIAIERARAEQALAEERTLLHTLINALPDSIFAKDRDTRFVLHNTAALKLMGGTAEELRGKTDWDVFPEEFVAAYYADDRRVIDTGEPLIEREEKTPNQAGETRWMQTTKVPLRNHKGEIIGLVGTARDITASKLTAEALRESEHKYRSLIEQSSDAIYLIRDGRFELINPRFTELLGLTIEDVSQPDFNIMDIVAPRSRPQVQARITKRRQGQVQDLSERYEFTGLTKDGREIELEVAISYFPYQNDYAIQGILRDITERKQAEAEMRRLNEMLEQRVNARTSEIRQQHRQVAAILDSVADAVIVTDMSGRIILQNPVASALRHAAPDAPDLTRQIDSLRATLNDQDVTTHTETLTIDGLVLQAKAARVLDDGRPLGTVIVLRDITALQALDELKSKFVSNVSHELRTPITNMKFYLPLLRRGRAERRAEYLTVMEHETERLERLINDLLDLSRLEADDAPRQREPLDLDALLAQICLFNRAQADEKDLTLRHQRPPAPLPPLLADRDQLMQVLTNLIGNAIAYTPPGGQITASVARCAMPHSEAAGLLVTVRDTGMGIAEADLARIFERFYRGENATTSQQPGTGLGLAISKEIVEQHYGTITVDSQLNQGSTFRIYLPLAAPTGSPPDVSPETAIVALAKESPR